MEPSVGEISRAARRGVAQFGLARLLWEQEVPGSNPGAPTEGHGRFIVVDRDLAACLPPLMNCHAATGRLLTMHSQYELEINIKRLWTMRVRHIH
jgi:hypothetical protein